MSEIRLEVKIDGITYPLVSNEPKESLEEIAKYVDRKIKEVKSDKLTFDRQLILACLNIADEYQKYKKEAENFKEENKEAIEKYPTIAKDFEDFKEEYQPYKEKFTSLDEENKKLRSILQDKDQELIQLQKAENDASQLRETIKKLQKQAMDLAKENETLKGKL